jgi:coenzyme F420-0:L-glutamate ligase / coenzyme F420-1:gamma-L-glutamate ligase
VDQSLTPKESRWTACLFAVPNLPLVVEGDDIAHLIFSAATEDRFAFRDDVVVVAQKIVSKAEGAVVRLNDVEPSPRAQELAEATGRDPHLCEVYVRESREILGTKDRMVITRHRLGFICTNAGVDRSNIGPEAGELALLLPRDPDASARAIRDKLRALTGCDVAVIISDSFGKPDRRRPGYSSLARACWRHKRSHR